SSSARSQRKSDRVSIGGTPPHPRQRGWGFLLGSRRGWRREASALSNPDPAVVSGNRYFRNVPESELSRGGRQPLDAPRKMGPICLTSSATARFRRPPSGNRETLLHAAFVVVPVEKSPRKGTPPAVPNLPAMERAAPHGLPEPR